MANNRTNFRAVFEFLQTSKLINLDQSIATVAAAASKISDEVDGDLICWQAYVLVHAPQVGPIEEGGGN